jgi:hypothetical protein
MVGLFYLNNFHLNNQYSLYIQDGKLFNIFFNRCATEAGGKDAPLTPEQGTISMLHVINNIKFGRDPIYHAKFYD